MRVAGAVVLTLLLAGCGGSTDQAQLADAVASSAAEGALLAHEVEEGDVTGAFRRVHAEALREKLDGQRKSIADERLQRIAAAVSRDLEQLATGPRDAAAIERRLERASKDAEATAQ